MYLSKISAIPCLTTVFFLQVRLLTQVIQQNFSSRVWAVSSPAVTLMACLPEMLPVRRIAVDYRVIEMLG